MDEDIDLVEVEPYLRALGFITKSALTIEPPPPDDVTILKYARRYNWILVSHDKHEPARKRSVNKSKRGSGRPTPAAWFSQLANKGGRVIEIEGGQQQEALEAVGKLIAHRHSWLAFFAESHGAVLVHANGMERKGPARLLRELGTHLTLAEQLPAKPPALQQRPKKRAPRKRTYPGDGLTHSFAPVGPRP